MERNTERKFCAPPTAEEPAESEFRKEWGSADGFQQYLAGVLPELSSRVEGDPPTASAEWTDTIRHAKNLLKPLTQAPEVTEGAASMSRRIYAAEALRLLDKIDSIIVRMVNAPADDDADADGGTDPEGGDASEYEQRWLRESSAEIADLSFKAGVLTRAAAGKAIEADAVKKYQVAATNRKNGALGGQADKKAQRYAVLNQLALANSSKFTNATDAQRLRNAKTIAREYDKKMDQSLFHGTNGRLLSNLWFKAWLHEYLALARHRQQNQIDTMQRTNGS